MTHHSNNMSKVKQIYGVYLAEHYATTKIKITKAVEKHGEMFMIWDTKLYIHITTDKNIF